MRLITWQVLLPSFLRTLLLDVTPGTPAYDISQVKLKFDSLSPGKDIYGSPIPVGVLSSARLKVVLPCR